MRATKQPVDVELNRELIHTRYKVKRCIRCHAIKSVTVFSKTKEGFTGARCLECVGETYVRHSQDKKLRQIVTGPEAPKKEPYGMLKTRIRQAMMRSFKSYRGIDGNNITMNYMVNLFIEQRGICAISGRKMTMGTPVNRRPHRYAVSIDRIDSTKGYIVGNVRFVTYQVNVAKSDGTDAELIEMCRDILRLADSKEAFHSESVLQSNNGLSGEVLLPDDVQCEL